MSSRPGPLLLIALGSFFTTACVSSAKHQATLAELDKLRSEAQRRDEEVRARTARLDRMLAESSARIDDLERRLAEKQAALDQMSAERDRVSKELDNSTLVLGQLKERLQKLGQNVDKLTAEKGQLSTGLSEAKARLEELRRQKAAAEARAATFRNLLSKLRAMIDAGQLKVVIREGRMLIALPNDVLFDSGKTAIRPAGQAALSKVAQVLAGIADRRFLVAGHTDNVPIHMSRFPSNWELSTARAVEVTKLLIQNGMRPEVLAAAGHGEFDPVGPNDTPEHRAQNRRIEIVLQPNLSDLPSLDDIQQAR